MEKTTVIRLKNDCDISFRQVENDCCIYIRDTDNAAVLNASAACAFLFLNECIEKGTLSITFGEILERIRSVFRIPPHLEENTVEKDIENLILRFCEVGLYVKAVET